MTSRIYRLGPTDDRLFNAWLTMFGDAFGEPDTYGNARPGAAWRRDLLGNETFIALAALDSERVTGGLAAYELPKFEQERREIYVYDLAVAADHRRRGIATALLRETQRIAAARGAWVVYVQADPEDLPAVALYDKLGTREAVLHFDLPVPGGADRGSTDSGP